jgi:hypothetical protein
MLPFSYLLMIFRSSILCLAAAVALGIPAGAQIPVGDLSATDASVTGAVVMTAGDTRVMSGSHIAAGQATAALRLARGGEVDICPHSSLSVTASQNGSQLTLAIGTGAMETHFRLGSSADTILTPDFRILLAGPGDFHFAIASDTQGNTCVRALPSDSASVIVNELLGDGVYQVGPGGQVMFHAGSIKGAESAVPPDCGCPPLPAKPETENVAAPASSPVAASSPKPVPSSVTAPPPPVPAGEVHISVDAPFVFRATDPVVPPSPVVARLRLQTLPPLFFGVPPVASPPPVPPPETKPELGEKTATKKGFFGKLRSLLAAVFR